MNLSQIRQDADYRLQQNDGSFSKLILFHTAITAGASVLLMLVNWLSQYITPGGGLSNMDAQNLLSTGQVLLQLLITIATPLWEAGLIYCTLQLIKNRSCTADNLPEGFRRWGPVASSLVIRGLIYFAVCIGCYFLTSLVISFIPFSPSILADLAAFIEAPTLPLSDGVRTFLLVLCVAYIASLCVLLIPKLYLHRLVVYRIVDDAPCGGLQAVLHSRILMKGHRKTLLLLDLSFWWFYLLEFCIGLLSIGYLFLSGLGIALPISTKAAAWLFPLSALLARIALYWFAKPKLAISYALFYQEIFEQSLKEPELPQPPQMP